MNIIQIVANELNQRNMNSSVRIMIAMSGISFTYLSNVIDTAHELINTARF